MSKPATGFFTGGGRFSLDRVLRKTYLPVQYSTVPPVGARRCQKVPEGARANWHQLAPTGDNWRPVATRVHDGFGWMVSRCDLYMVNSCAAPTLGRTIRLLPLNGASRRIFDRKCACEQHKKVRVGYVTRGQGVAGRARVCGGRTPWWKPRMTIPPVIVAVSHGRQSVASTGVSPAPRPIQWPRSVTIHAMFSLRRAGDSPFVF